MDLRIEDLHVGDLYFELLFDFYFIFYCLAALGWTDECVRPYVCGDVGSFAGGGARATQICLT